MSRRAPPPIEGLYSLKVDNISYNTTQADLRRMFDKYGEIGDIHIPRDKYTRQSKGFGFVRFYSRRDAEYAMDRTDGRWVEGREIRVAMARYERPIDERGAYTRRGSVFRIFYHIEQLTHGRARGLLVVAAEAVLLAVQDLAHLVARVAVHRLAEAAAVVQALVGVGRRLQMAKKNHHEVQMLVAREAEVVRVVLKGKWCPMFAVAASKFSVEL
uniref:RRM domain-containing protein n=1 Tax=Haemonchus contortus TaxID=6289 RepID=A0A7I4Y534_HAECO|nr:RNA recognition motif domain containing protein [Haemonchus contortus]